MTSRKLTSSSFSKVQDEEVPQPIKKSRPERQFDPAKYNTRLIALKLAYLGKNYNGFEHHTNNVTPLPTIEEELWKALNKARLIFPQCSSSLAPGEVNWEGCEYSKCGRTDKGVSAFGQVIGIRVRSNRPLSKKKAEPAAISLDEDVVPESSQVTHPRESGIEVPELPLSPSSEVGQAPAELSLDGEHEEAPSFDPIVDEIQYPSILNRLLPPDIRIIGWCPAPPSDFSARFSCRERQYRYFFTQPAFVPTPGNLEDPNSKGQSDVKDGWLDIAAMKEAASYFLGVHDFRNFCKVDGSKQLTNFERNIFYADIVEVPDTTSVLEFVNGKEFLPASRVEMTSAPKVYTFTLHGSAFLWHQVRHMVAILFLVGQGLEPPSIVKELLDAEKNPCRPLYEMASDTPLVLWNCVFPQEDDPERKDIMQWHYVGDGAGAGDTKFGSPGLIEDLWKVWRERKIDEVLAGSLIDVVARQGIPAGELTASGFRRGGKSQKLFDGGDKALLRGTYLPVMKKPKLEPVQSINEKYAVRKGFENAEEMKELGFRRLNKPASSMDDAA
jgi:tRNA pseudouridine38/39 synthase